MLNHDGFAENTNSAVVEDNVAVQTVVHVEHVGQDAVTEGAIAPPTSEEAASTAMVAVVATTVQAENAAGVETAATSASLEPNGV